VHSNTGKFNVDPSTILKAGLEGHTTDANIVSFPGLLSNCSTLHVAVYRNNADAVDTLLDLGVSLSVKDAKGFSPLHYAASAGNNTLVEKLIRAGATPNATTPMHITPLMSAAAVSGTQTASVLLKHGANLAAVDSSGRTALHHAAQGQSNRMFMFLLDAGCDPYQLDDKKHSPILYALSRRHLATYVYACCLDVGHIVRADTAPRVGPGICALRLFLCYSSETTKLSFLTMETEEGHAVFIGCAIHSGPDYIRVCIKAGAQLEITRNNGDTALLAACRAGKLRSVAYLVRHGAKLEYEHQGRTLNAYIAACGHPEVIRWLLVERWTGQGKLGSESANIGEQVQCQFWTGVRTVMIPLRGDYERPKGSSLFDHAKYLHGFAKQGWRILVPLGWDTVANLVPLPGEA
jgi:ankyrin repeat protein